MKKFTCVFTAAMLILSLSACSSSKESLDESQQPESIQNVEEEPSGSQSKEENKLADWEGTWNNFYSYFENPDLEEAYQILAGREGIPAKQIKERYLEKETYQCEIEALRIKDGEITFYSKPQTSEGVADDAAASANYTYAGDETDENGRKWSHFQTSDKAPYTHLILLPAEADVPGTTMRHFHFRYGDDLEALLASEDWFATMVEYDNDISLLVGHMTYRETALSNWSGTWNNFYTYLEDPGLEEAYATLAEREGKTAAEVKARYLEEKTYQCEIPSLQIDEESITFYNKTQSKEGSKEDIEATAEYTYAGEVTDDFDRTWAHFKAEGEAPYKNLFLLPAESDDPGNTMLHFHFRYGDHVEELKSAEGWYATMVKYDSSISLLAGHMTFEE